SGHFGHWNAFRSVEYRNAIRVCVGLAWSYHPALSRSWTAPGLPGTRRNCGAGVERDLLRATDVGIANSDMAAVLRMAADRFGNLPVLQPQAQRVRSANACLDVRSLQAASVIALSVFSQSLRAGAA